MNKFLSLLVVLITIILPRSADALTISPTKIEVAADPGQTIMGEIELFNEESETKTFYTSFENFEPRGETGAPFFVGAGAGLATWLGAQGTVSIATGERAIVPYSITIPNDAVPGGYFAAVFFGSQPPTSDGNGEVSIGGKVGSLVLLRVNGVVEEGGGVLDFTKSTGKKFSVDLPVALSYRFNNTGADRVVPRGEIEIKNIFGMHVVTLNANLNEGSVLPNSIRKFEVLWGSDIALVGGKTEPSFMDIAFHQAKNLHIGFYKANLSVTWGESQQKAVSTYSFVLLPWQLMSVVFFVAIVLYFILRQYNRFIISRAKHG